MAHAQPRRGLDEILAAVIELLGAEKGNIQLLDPRGPADCRGAARLRASSWNCFAKSPPPMISCAPRHCARGSASSLKMSRPTTPYAPLRAVARAAGYRSLVCHSAGERRRRTARRCFDSLSIDPSSLRAGDAAAWICICVKRAISSSAASSSKYLQRSEEALRDADRRKDEFLALLAHELRNPLAPIRYALAANRKAGRTPEQRSGRRGHRAAGRAHESPAG